MNKSNAVGRLPDFLIVGAMKAGTTTLYRDLYQHPNIFLPEQKEPNDLVKTDIQEPANVKSYVKLFASADDGCICGEASTAYTKMPRFMGVAENAYNLLGANLKIIYVVRHPVDRAISQYMHEFGESKEELNINHALKRNERYLDYSKYHNQIQPWLTIFGRQNILVLEFEEYISNRRLHLDKVCAFLDVDSYEFVIEKGIKYNQSSGRLVINNSVLKKIRDSLFYQRYLKKYLGWRFRQRIRSIFIKPQKTSDLPVLSPDVSTWFMRELGDDIARFSQSFGIGDSWK